MMSVFDALDAWQDEEISVAKAMALTGASSIPELYAYADLCDVDIRIEATPAEMKAADAIKVTLLTE